MRNKEYEWNIVAPAFKLVEGRPDEDVVKAIEGMLEEAKRGEILSFGACYVMSEGRIGTYRVAKKDVAALLGAATLLTDRIKGCFDDEDD